MTRGMIAGCIAAAAMFGNGAAVAQDVTAQARDAIATYSGTQTEFHGPTSAPQPEKGKSIVYLSNDENNSAAHAWGEAIREAAAKIGWDVTIIDGKATPTGWISGLNQAIALKADGVVTLADAAEHEGADRQCAGGRDPGRRHPRRGAPRAER